MRGLLQTAALVAAMALPFLFGGGLALAESGQAPRVSSFDFRNATDGTINILNGVAMNVAAGSRTITLNTGKAWAALKVHVFYTESAGSNPTATFSCSSDGTNFASKTSRAVTAGASTVSVLIDTFTTAVSANFTLEYGIAGCQKVKIVFDGTGMGGSDLITVQATGVSGV